MKRAVALHDSGQAVQETHPRRRAHLQGHRTEIEPMSIDHTQSYSSNSFCLLPRLRLDQLVTRWGHLWVRASKLTKPRQLASNLRPKQRKPQACQEAESCAGWVPEIDPGQENMFKTSRFRDGTSPVTRHYCFCRFCRVAVFPTGQSASTTSPTNGGRQPIRHAWSAELQQEPQPSRSPDKASR